MTGVTLSSICGIGVRLRAFVDEKGSLAAFESSDDGKTPCRLVPGPIKEFSELVSEVLVSLFVTLLESLLPHRLLETS